MQTGVAVMRGQFRFAADCIREHHVAGMNAGVTSEQCAQHRSAHDITRPVALEMEPRCPGSFIVREPGFESLAIGPGIQSRAPDVDVG